MLAVAKALLRNMAGLDSAASTSRVVDVFLEPFMTSLVRIFEMLDRRGMEGMWVFRVSVKCAGNIGIWCKNKGGHVREFVVQRKKIKKKQEKEHPPPF